MNVRRDSILCILFLFLAAMQGTKTYAQQTLVDVKIDVADIMIGEQTMLRLSVTTDKDKPVLVPLPGEKLMEGVEVLRIMPPDTADIKNNRITINYDLVITSFDSSLYLLPPFVAIDGRDTLYSNQVALKVSSPDVNLENPEEYFDIKQVWRPPFVLADYYPLIYGVLFTLFLICVIGYFIQRMRNRSETGAKADEGPKLPPHEQAFLELKQIREQKLWQQGRNKEYYTEITDTLKRYITARYGTSVLEKTSGEIFDVIRNEEPGRKEIHDPLKQILQLADFVKFAKMHPLPDENDITMVNANVFVDRTKIIEVAPPTADSDAEQVKTNDDGTIQEEINKNDEPTNK